MALPAGTRLGPYEIASFIGAGTMGVIYKARSVHDIGSAGVVDDEKKAMYSPSVDGQRVLLMSSLVPRGTSPLVGVLNWAAGLPK